MDALKRFGNFSPMHCIALQIAFKATALLSFHNIGSTFHRWTLAVVLFAETLTE